MVTTVDPVQEDDRLALIATEAERWKRHHAEALSKLAVGTSVIIDIATGEYVTAENWHKAQEAYDHKFGPAPRMCFAFDVDRPIFTGGGLWRR